MISMCSLRVGEGVFGIDTEKVREVLGESTLQRVPLAPDFVGGVMSYRGDVLVVVCARKLLGMAAREGAGSVLVMLDEQEGELFGLAVDAVDDVVGVESNSFEENPCTLDAIQKAIFDGVYKVRDGVMVRLQPDLLRPSRLTGLPWAATHNQAAGNQAAYDQMAGGASA